jgi:AcrR family transcriptional regulator
VDATPPARRGRPGYDRETLLRIAVEVFIEKGYDATSMDDLGRRLGLSKAAIYHHVSGKEELLRVALDRALDGLEAVERQVEDSGASAVDRLEHYVRGSVRVLVEELPYVTLLLRVRGNTATEHYAMQRRRHADGLATMLVERAVAAGDLRPDIHPATTARLIFGMVNSLVEWYVPGGPVGAPELADQVWTALFAGLRADPP